MKIINKIKLVLPLLISLLFLASCSSDDQQSVTQEEFPELALNTNAIEIEIGKTSSVNITTGGGEYNAYSSNEDIVTAVLDSESKTITLNALAQGEAYVIISDKNDQYIEVAVSSYPTKVKLSTYNVEISTKLGHEKTVEVDVLEGYPGYSISSESVKGIVGVRFLNEKLIISAKKEGEVTLVVADSKGLEAELTVKVITTIIPYTNDELQQIMDDNRSRYFLGDQEIDTFYFTKTINFNNNLNLYELNYYNFSFFRIYFSGDKSVGEKENGSVEARLSNIDGQFYGQDFPITPTDNLEIIKNDGEKIWLVYSFVKDEKLTFGYFCEKINL